MTALSIFIGRALKMQYQKHLKSTEITAIPSNQNVEHEVEAAELVQLIDSFVMSLSPMERRIFICRYWYFDPISEIAQRFGFSQSKVKMMLHRQRKNLLNRLEREEFL